MQCFFYSPPGSIRFCQSYIFKDRGFEKPAVLKNIGDGLHQFGLSNILYIHAADFDLAACHIPKAGDQSGSHGFASAIFGPAILNIAANPSITGTRQISPNRQSNKNSMTIIPSGVATAPAISGS